MPRPLHIKKEHMTPDTITWKDFSGTRDRGGMGNFTIRFSEEEGEMLEADGWRIRWREDDQGERYATLKVNIAFHGDTRDPIIETATFSSKRPTRLTKDEMHLLDSGVMVEYTVDISPWWSKDKQDYAAYLQRIMVIQEDDIFAKAYPQFYGGSDDEDVDEEDFEQ